MNPIVIGAFKPFGLKKTNQAQEVAGSLKQLQEKGELSVPKDTDVVFLSMETNADSVQNFVDQAKKLNPSKVLMLGEDGLSTRIEKKGKDRGKPLSAPLSALGFSRHPSRGEIESPADVGRLAKAAGVGVSGDAGKYYCNYAYHTALQAGLNAIFVHVPSGILGLGKAPEKATKQVNRILDEWFISDPNAAGKK